MPKGSIQHDSCHQVVRKWHPEPHSATLLVSNKSELQRFPIGLAPLEDALAPTACQLRLTPAR